MSLFALNAAHNEYSLMKSYKHSNILETKGLFEDTEYIIIVYELMSSDLRAILSEINESLAHS